MLEKFLAEIDLKNLFEGVCVTFSPPSVVVNLHSELASPSEHL